MNQGWIKLHRKITEWEWYTETNTFAVFMHLILTCNFKPTRWRGIELEVGESIKALGTLAKETKLSVRNVRTAIKRLKSTGEVTERKHGKHRILKLKNYKQYQLGDTESDNEVTRKRQGSDKEVTIDKECKKGKNEKNEKKRENTPEQQMKGFIESIREKDNLYQSLSEKLSSERRINIDKVRAELTKFVDYWTELNSTGTKQRWEMEKTFEVQRRLTTWFSRTGSYGGKKQRTGRTIS